MLLLSESITQCGETVMVQYWDRSNIGTLPLRVRNNICAKYHSLNLATFAMEKLIHSTFWTAKLCARAMIFILNTSGFHLVVKTSKHYASSSNSQQPLEL